MGNGLKTRTGGTAEPAEEKKTEDAIHTDNDNPPDLIKQFSSEYNVQEFSDLQETLSSKYNNMDTAVIDDVLRAICIGKENKQSFGFLIDVCSLMSVASKRKDSFTLQKFISENQINVFDSKGQSNFSKENFANACNQYISAFGDCVLPAVHPQILIQDCFAAFLSYTLSMSNAIKQYIDPQPPIRPLIIDFWIIPNLTIGAEGPLENQIGDIEHRLKSNRLIYTKKTCTPKNVDLNIDKIIQCLSSKDIMDALKQRELNRVVFIIDRRLKGKDFMYCYVPPDEYAKITGFDDVLSICHAHCCSHYLLPKSSKSPNAITAISKVNGYLFMLSFLIYERDEEEMTREDFEQQQFMNMMSNREQKASLLQMSAQQRKQYIQQQSEEVQMKINDLSQISTAFVKCYFHRDGFRIRFFPSHIWTVWRKFFTEQAQVGLKHDDTSRLVSSAFGLYCMFISLK